MARRIVPLFIILAGARIEWSILGATLLLRTQTADDTDKAALGSLWGPAQTQCAPTFSYTRRKTVQELALRSSRVAVDMTMEQRRKGLLYYSTYNVRFAGVYSVVDDSRAGSVIFAMHLPDQAVYDGVDLRVDGHAVEPAISGGSLTTTINSAGGREHRVSITYRSQGSVQWSYQFGSGTNAVRNFDLAMHTNFDAIDFPGGTLAPTVERRSKDGWDLDWNYRDLVAGYGIGMVLPEPLQPGPLASRITFWAPLSLFFYFFVMFIITTIRRIDLHPMHYFFLGCAFFAFHLLFAYTVDRLPIGLAFTICSAVSMFLTVSYLRLIVGLRFAAVEAALAQFLYLILFSLALFNEGFSGLAITVGSIITLYVTMQLTARIDWEDAGPKAAAP